MKRSTVALAVANIVAYLAMVVVNGLANALPLNGRQTGEISDAYPNLFVPAGLTFAIWGLIYLLLLGFVVAGLVAALREGEAAGEVARIGPLFLVSSGANLAWIFAWHWERIPLTLVLMLVILGSLIWTCLRLDIGRRSVGPATRLTMHLPFSVYLGWITVATIANVTALLVSIGWGGLGIGPVTWTVSMIVVASAITLAVIVTRRDLAYTLVIAWAFLGIYLERTAEGDAPAVAWTAIAAAGVLTAAAVGGRVRAHRRGRT